ncbi:MAG TPA: flotillin family protein, partial [Burkholderiales bacterium]|nr:flotillin family protein [Burkholderiales bacterium]
VILDGGALVLPVFHEVITVNMNTLRLEVKRSDTESLIAKDRLRVDVIAAFFVRVIPSVEGIANAAQTLGQRTLDPDALKQLVEAKFVDALRSTAATMTMQQLQDQRQEFVQGVQSAVSEDLLKNGLELESVSLTSLDQTRKEFFDPQNAFDAEGLTRLTAETENRRRERNEIEQNTEVAVRQKNVEATQQKLEISKQERFLTLEQEREVANREAQQKAEIAAYHAEREREAAQIRIAAERKVKEAEIERDQGVKARGIEAEQQIKVATIEQERATEIAAQIKAIAIAQKSEEQSHAQAKANEARAEAVRAEQAVETAKETAEADRDRQVAIIDAAKHAEQSAIAVTTAARAEKDAAEHRSAAMRVIAEADRVRFEVEALGKRIVNEAINVLSSEQIGLQVKLAVINALPSIIEKSVEPMRQIDGIKIVQVDGLNRGGADGNGAANGNGSDGMGKGNFAEQAVSAALAYRAHAPIIDTLMKEVGLSGSSLAGLAGVTAEEFVGGLETPFQPPRLDN